MNFSERQAETVNDGAVIRPLNPLPGHVAVMGAGRSGIAAARYLHAHGVRVFVSDTCSKDTLRATLEAAGLSSLEYEAGGHTARILQCELIVLSPGIPSDLPVLGEARARGIEVWSEMELGYRCSVAEFVAVTGSSGKSTTTSMVGEILRLAGRQTVVAGNIGTPVISVAPPLPSTAICVAEVSSFQLETCYAFKPRVAVVLNLQKNHLDRYRSEEDYYEAKKRITRNLGRTCFLVLNGRDERLRTWAKEMSARTRVAFFGVRVADSLSVWCEAGRIVADRGSGVECLVETASLRVCGEHNYENASAAAAAALAAGVSPQDVGRGLEKFEGLPHRLQRIGTWGGVTWYNDSKATTAESVLVALKAFTGNVILIAGGRDKGCDFSLLYDTLKTHVKMAILIGEAAGRMEREWRGATAIARVGTLLEAVQLAAHTARSGDVVVLSPGCSSFDMFRDYEDRGRTFVALVREHVPALLGER